MSTPITIVGNMTEPEIRFTNSGTAVCGFSVAVNRGHRDKDSGNWVEDGTDWYRVTAWRDLGQNVADSLEKGARVVVTGRLEQEMWTNKDNEERLSVKVIADEVGPSLRWATAEVQKAERKENVTPAVDPFASSEPF